MAVDTQAILVHGHRGARARMPENTIPAFEYAIAAGADVLELDLAVTKDNVLVVSHDPYLHGPMCKGPVAKATIRELTLAQVREWDCGAQANPQFPQQKAVPGTKMPTLDEVLQLAKKGKFEFNIETKIFAAKPELTPSPEEFAGLLVKAIEKHKLVRRCIIQSFDFRTLVAARKLNPRIRLSALLEARKAKDFVRASQEAANAEIVSPHYTLVTPEKVSAAHAAGLQVVPWTANEPADWDKLIEAKSDAIISDDPATLLEHLRQKKLHK